MTVIVGDMRKIVPKLPAHDLVFADPPFNIGHPYQDFDDRNPDFEKFIAGVVETCWQVCDGVLALHGNDALCEEYLIAARRLGMRRIAWINWHYRFGVCSRRNWIDARCHCLIYAKHDAWTWNPDDVLVPSDRAAVYNDKRCRPDNEHYRANSGQRLPGTVWGVPSDGLYWGRVQGSSVERRAKHPNQLPEVYLERLSRSYTNVGDKVLDPFAGSGTTAVVAEALARSATTIDVSRKSARSVRERLKKGVVREMDPTKPMVWRPIPTTRRATRETKAEAEAVAG